MFMLAPGGSPMLSARMDACRLVQHGKPGVYEFGGVEDTHPGEGEAVVSVHACGLNRLDLWAEEAALPIPVELPLIQGCEPAGQICELGSGVSGWKIGDRVAVQSNLFCGACESCAKGDENLCLKGSLIGVQQNGGFAQKMVVPQRVLVPIPAGVSYETAASLGLAAATAMHMLTKRVRIQPQSVVLVVGGTSGVGSAAIQIARQLGARVFALSSTEAKRTKSISLGAELVFDSSRPDWPRQVRAATGRRGVDVVVEHVGGVVLPACFECLARGGSIVTCGATAGRDVALNLWPLFVKEQSLVGSYGRTREDMKATFAWADQGLLRPVIQSVLPLRELPAAIADLRAGNVAGKIVIKP